MFQRCNPRLSVSFGAVLLWAWFLLVNGWKLTSIIMLAAFIHEMGHLLVLWLAGAGIDSLHIGVFGAVLRADTSRLSYGKELAAVLAGPLANLVTALICGIWGESSLFIGTNVILSCFNLLPVCPLDGGRALHLLALCRWGMDAGERLSRMVGGVTALLLAGGLAMIMYQTGGSLWLLPPAGWMLTTAVRNFLGK